MTKCSHHISLQQAFPTYSCQFVLQYSARCFVLQLHCGVQMLTDEERKQVQLVEKANLDMIYLNDMNMLVSCIVACIMYNGGF